jgi:hypothetical protein
MNTLASDVSWRLQELALQVRRGIRLVRRTGPGPLLVRILSGVGAATALAAGAPDVLEGWVWVAVALAVLVGLAPRTRLVGLVGLAALALWLIRTSAEHGDYSIVRLAVLGVALYLTHSCAALAAGLPYDAIIGGAVLLRRIGRIGITAVVGMGFGVGCLVAARVLPALHGVAGAVAGSTAAVLLLAILVWSAHRSD